jgi:hypothetical protein
MEALGLMLLGAILILSAPFGHFDSSWKSRWEVAGAGALAFLLGLAFLLLEILL